MKRYAAALWVMLAVPHATHAAPPQTWEEPATGMPFVAIPKGCYLMGTAESIPYKPDPFWEQIRHTGTISADEVPQHEVCVDGFWMGKFEVRNREWQQLMGESPGGANPEQPVVAVTLAQVRAFAERLTERSGGAHRFRLPTEAEWEYACRAGVAHEVTPVGTELVGKSWYGARGAYKPEPHEVGLLPPNAFGLHDMLGNVWEWTEDSYVPGGYARHALHNPKVTAQPAQHVIRGGSFRSEPRQTRCAVRGHYDAGEKLDSIGFRLVRQ